MTVETSASPSSASTDDALIAELTPAMLGKLKADSRQQAIHAGFVWTVVGGFILPNLFKQFAPSESSLQPNQLDDWIGLLVLMMMIGFGIYGGVTMIRGFIGQSALLRTELRYRRLHGKWRWER